MDEEGGEGNIGCARAHAIREMPIRATMMAKRRRMAFQRKVGSLA